MHTATVSASKYECFRRGLLDGLTAPFKVFEPKRTMPRFDKSILDSSYVDRKIDAENIRSDFEKVLQRVQAESKSSSRKIG